MPDAINYEVDIVEELRLRRWARENYLPPGERDSQHPVVAHEMRLRDAEVIIEARCREPVGAFVPLAPAPIREIHAAHDVPAPPTQRVESQVQAQTQWLC